ncbi:CYP3A4 [Cordylochernes scorpioides]|uniref:CYP3A4 n=1 Tax=Cordylochernes scorpioides TaxID=51811 RepID=A0ABY6LIF1_9ARAC|nr:CYP3A4 [Cordylochernes scorpioides]
MAELVGISERHDAVQRLAIQDYEINGKKIPKSIPFLVPLDALHRSEKYWNNPDEFDPERFSPEQKANIPAFVYQPFGAGPRMCIGMRMANMVDKALLALILSKFRLVASSETDKVKPQLKDTMFILHPKLPVKVRLERLG